MLPVLVDIGFIKIYTFGVFLLLAFFWGAFSLWKNTSLTSYKEEQIFDGMFFSLLGGLICGRVLHIILHFSEFGFNILKFILINGYPGIHVFGFIFGFMLFYFLFSQSNKISFLKSIDYIIPSFFLALAIGKLGSFFSGTEIGVQTQFFVAIPYPNMDGVRHLTSLYESILFFLGTYLTYRFIFFVRKEQLHSGFNLLLFVWYVSLVEFVFDPLKTFRTMHNNTSIEMMISGILLLTGTVFFIYYFRTSIKKWCLKLLKKDKH